jgi:hypothetical protein
MMIALLNARSGIPTIVLHLPEKLVVFHHTRTTRLMMIQMNKSTIPKSFFEIGNVLR